MVPEFVESQTTVGMIKWQINQKNMVMQLY